MTTLICVPVYPHAFAFIVIMFVCTGSITAYVSKGGRKCILLGSIYATYSIANASKLQNPLEV